MNEKSLKSKMPTRIKFLIIVCLLYIFYFIIDQDSVIDAFINTLKMFYNILPVLFVVFIIQLITNRYLKKELIDKFLGNQAGLSGWLYSTIAGILVSGPPYILFPLLGDLKNKGMKNELIAVFLYNRNVKIPFLPVLVYYFGFAYTVVISVYIIIFSFLNGFLIKSLDKR